MRKSSATIMAILMVCFGTMLVAANVLSKPLQEDATVAIELTRLLGHQELIAKNSKVFVSRRPANEFTLAKHGRGAVLELEPSEKIRDKRNGLNSMARRLIREIRTNFSQHRLDWIEVRFITEDLGRLRTLVERGPDGRYAQTHELVQDKPAEAKPAAVKPATAKPVVATPATVKPVVVKPAPVKPAQGTSK